MRNFLLNGECDGCHGFMCCFPYMDLLLPLSLEYDGWLSSCVSAGEQGQLLPAAIVSESIKEGNHSSLIVHTHMLTLTHTHTLIHTHI